MAHQDLEYQDHEWQQWLERFIDANWFAAWKHRDQRRSDFYASPYVNHVIETCRVLVVNGITDRPTLVSAFLHDVLETTTATPAQIENRFGKDIRRIVQELTVDPRLDQAVRRAIQLEKASSLSQPARLIRLADKTANLRTLRVDRTIAENREYLDWAEKVAHAVKGVNRRLDLAFDWMLKRARQQLRDAEREGWPPLKVAAVRAGDKRRNMSKPHTNSGSWRHQDQTFLRILAEPGVRSVDIEWFTNHAIGWIDGWKLPLTTLRAHLLSVLADFRPPGDDRLSPFLPKEEAAAELGRRMGRMYGGHGFDVVVDRLQDHLYDHSLNPLLIEEDLAEGIRFRWRRPAPGPGTLTELKELVTV
jgi:guanosine-3',5'-bis(diphosphate) 3'-pyrophosphohydrolase